MKVEGQTIRRPAALSQSAPYSKEHGEFRQNTGSNGSGSTPRLMFDPYSDNALRVPKLSIVFTKWLPIAFPTGGSVVSVVRSTVHTERHRQENGKSQQYDNKQYVSDHQE